MNTKKIMLSILDNTTELDNAIALKIGKQNLAARYFKHAIPTPYEIEMAIIEIEDAIAAIQSDWQSLIKHDAIEITASKTEFADIFIFAHATDLLTTEQLEFAFNRLADIVSGSPKRLNEFPDSIEFISEMLILREVMHHLNITKIHLVG